MHSYTRTLFNAAVLERNADAMAVADWLMTTVMYKQTTFKILTPSQAQIACIVYSRDIAGRMDEWIAEWNEAEAEAFD